jgi:hypothetical protein
MCQFEWHLILAFFTTLFLKGVSMKIVMTALVSAFMLMSAPSFAGSHGGGKMDDKKVDCSKKENEKDKACVKK